MPTTRTHTLLHTLLHTQKNGCAFRKSYLIRQHWLEAQVLNLMNVIAHNQNAEATNKTMKTFCCRSKPFIIAKCLRFPFDAFLYIKALCYKLFLVKTLSKQLCELMIKQNDYRN
jgi:hypothetical protein